MVDTASLPEFDSFDWSGGNGEKNWHNHQVTPLECEQVFFNQPLIVADDEKHSADEKRYYVLGQTNAKRELFIVFTVRKRAIRIISARDMHRKERVVYRSL